MPGKMTATPDIKAKAATQSKGLSPVLTTVRSMCACVPRVSIIGSVIMATPSAATTQRGLSRIGQQHPFCGSIKILILTGPHRPEKCGQADDAHSECYRQQPN